MEKTHTSADKAFLEKIAPALEAFKEFGLTEVTVEHETLENSLTIAFLNAEGLGIGVLRDKGNAVIGVHDDFEVEDMPLLITTIGQFGESIFNAYDEVVSEFGSESISEEL